MKILQECYYPETQKITVHMNLQQIRQLMNKVGCFVPVDLHGQLRLLPFAVTTSHKLICSQTSVEITHRR